MYCMDANNFITGWQKHYPPSVFPSLWDKIATERKKLIIIEPIYDEIDSMSADDKQKTRQELLKSHPIKLWLDDNYFQPVPIKKNVEAVSLELEKKYEIPPNNQGGANKNDITLIAYAKMHDIPVVTFEEKQLQPPLDKNRYKIPLICQEEGVRCIKLPQCLEELGIII